jgi:hypothetical protein
MDDLIQSTEDSIEVVPSDLEPEFISVLTSSLAKSLAGQMKKPWTNELESQFQENISALVAAARSRHLNTIRVIITRPNGQQNSRELSVEKIHQTRSLQ